MSDEIKVINKRLRELNKEFSELSNLKKKLVLANSANTIKEKYGDYKFIVKDKVNQDLDFDKLITENDLKVQSSIYGMLCIAYKVGDKSVGYHIAKTEEEADQIRIVQQLFKVGDEISEQVKENKKLTAKEILEAYDKARHNIQKSENTEEVS